MLNDKPQNTRGYNSGSCQGFCVTPGDHNVHMHTYMLQQVRIEPYDLVPAINTPIIHQSLFFLLLTCALLTTCLWYAYIALAAYNHGQKYGLASSLSFAP